MSLLKELEEIDEDYNYFDTIGANLFAMEKLENPEDELGWNCTGKNEMRKIGWRPDGSGLYLKIGHCEKWSDWVFINQCPVIFMDADGSSQTVLFNNLIEMFRAIAKNGDYFNGEDYHNTVRYMTEEGDEEDKNFLIEAHESIKLEIKNMLERCVVRTNE